MEHYVQILLRYPINKKKLKPIYLFNDNTNLQSNYYTVKTW